MGLVNSKAVESVMGRQLVKRLIKVGRSPAGFGASRLLLLSDPVLLVSFSPYSKTLPSRIL